LLLFDAEYEVAAVQVEDVIGECAHRANDCRGNDIVPRGLELDAIALDGALMKQLADAKGKFALHHATATEASMNKGERDGLFHSPREGGRDGIRERAYP